MEKIFKTRLRGKILLLLFLGVIQANAQKTGANFGNPIITDSSSTLIIPTVYDAGVFSSNKLAAWGDYYSNIIFYNFKTDNSKKLFENDTYIVSLDKPYYYRYYDQTKNSSAITKEVILYRVLNYDRNNNGKIDDDDPVILYSSDINGNNLKALTEKNENVVELHVYNEQNFALVKIQRDSNKDNNFTLKDTDYYYVKLDLTTLSLGNKIELK